MTEAEEFQPDRLDGAPHPAVAHALFGQDAAEATFLQALAAERLHHAWLLVGPQGVGKATFAWRAAKHLLSTDPAGQSAGLFGAPEPASTLDTDPDDPMVARIMAGGEKRLFVLRRGLNDKGKPTTAITVDQARRLKGFFGLSVPDGGRRVVIVDAADEMNPQAANALLKALEEPPRDTVFLLVNHQPARLLPTIRSRCRVLRLAALDTPALGAALAQALGEPLPDAELAALAVLAEGSVGAAVSLRASGGAALYGKLVALLNSLPDLDRPLALSLSAAGASRQSPEQFGLLVQLTQQALARLARTGATGASLPQAVPGEAAAMARLAPDPAAARLWAEAAERLARTARAGAAVNLDPSALLLDMFHGLQTTARSLSL